MNNFDTHKDDDMSIKISIVLPVYNVERYIKRAILSCINQSMKDIEIIIVDDCGKDKSIEIATEMAQKDSRIKIIHNEKNLGTFMTRFNGVNAASGEYILFVDPDDFIALDSCEILYKKAKGSDIVCFNMMFGTRWLTNHYEDKSYTKDEFLRFLLKDYSWNINKMAKKETLLKAYYLLDKNIRISMAEDALIFLAYLFVAKDIVTIRDRLYFYETNNQDSSMQAKDKARIKEHMRSFNTVIKQIRKLYKKSNYNIYRFHCQCFMTIFKCQRLALARKSLKLPLIYRMILKLRITILVNKYKFFARNKRIMFTTFM